MRDEPLHQIQNQRDDEEEFENEIANTVMKEQ